MAYLGKGFKSLIDKTQRQDSNISGVSGFSFCAIEPIWKSGNDGIIRKLHFIGKLMYGGLFSWV